MKSITLTLAAILLLMTAACGRKNPVDTGDTPTCDHFDADGVVLDHRGAMLAVQWQATVTGSITVDEGAMLDSVLVTWLTPDSVRSSAPTTCFALRWEVADTNLVRAEAGAGGPWSVKLTGKAPGNTTIRVRIWHVDHADFTSQPIPITVVDTAPHVPVGASGALLFSGTNLAASHGFNIPGVYGKLPVALPGDGLTLGVQFLDAAENGITNLESGYTLGWAVGNPSVVAAEPVGGDPWAIRLRPLAAGATTIVVRLEWRGTAEYATGSFDVIVYDTLATPTIPASFLLKKSGLRHVFVRDGAEVPQCCSSVSTGFLPAVRDTIEDLFNFRLLAYNDCALPPSQRCAETTPSSTTAFVAFEFADPTLTGVVRHPEHVGEYHDFHLRGINVGETTMRVVYVTGTTVAFRSPPLRVVVSAAAEPRAAIASFD